MVDRIRRTGYLRGTLRRWTVGENLAWGTGRRATPTPDRRRVDALPGHRANILDRGFDEIGVGVVARAPRAPASLGAGTYVTNFGRG